MGAFYERFKKKIVHCTKIFRASIEGRLAQAGPPSLLVAARNAR